MMIESYISTLQFYGNIDRRITKKEIQVISQIQENLTLDDNFEMKNKIELADCYFHIGDNENKKKYQQLYDKWKRNIELKLAKEITK